MFAPISSTTSDGSHAHTCHRSSWGLIPGVLAGILSLSPSAKAGDDRVFKGAYYGTIPPEFITQLPQYCWGQFMDIRGPKYDIRKVPGCGVGINHFCPGLAALHGARITIDKKKKGAYILDARRNLEYTDRALQKMPQCALRAQLDPALQELELLLRLYGGKPRTK